MTKHWSEDAVFYHIYPLGLSGSPRQNNFSLPVQHRLEKLTPWLDHIESLGANAIYLGPVFQSTSHGYDTVDYMQVDRRLGDSRDLARFAEVVHQRGMRLVLDAVFNHVGRDFWAFKDVIEHGENSSFRHWFHNLRFDERSPKGDPFNYEGWHGHYSLVKLNLSHPAVREHLFNAAERWIEDFGIDGLRLDAADCIDLDFLRTLRRFTNNIHKDFWLLGEVVHGDYRRWANPETLNTVTNYESYKGLYSSLIDGNYHEIAYALNRQFGLDGIYRDLQLYNFVDNHDVDRVASKLPHQALLYPLYLLLFTMPGIPSIYYGSEWGIEGEKTPWSDDPLRPALDLQRLTEGSSQGDLVTALQQLAKIRLNSNALKYGTYRTLQVKSQQMAFLRAFESEKVVVCLNSGSDPTDLEISLPWKGGWLMDMLEPGVRFNVRQGQLGINIPPTWGRILRLDG